jgi:hypothetical protein
MMGGPPFWHLAGGEPIGTAGTQLPPAQPVVAPQMCPHVPQLLLSVDVLTHVPLHAVRLAAQLFAQVPLRQTLPGSQTTLQPPQFAGSLLVGMHWPPQGDWYSGHAHAPATHAPPVHVFPQPPQFCVSVSVLTHLPPQSTRGEGQTQFPPEQTLPPPHFLPQPPQLFGSVSVKKQSLPQSAQSGSQVQALFVQ